MKCWFTKSMAEINRNRAATTSRDQKLTECALSMREKNGDRGATTSRDHKSSKNTTDITEITKTFNLLKIKEGGLTSIQFDYDLAPQAVEEYKQDLEYFVAHCRSKETPIHSAFDFKEWKKFAVYKVRFGFIYNPSRFYVVREHAELDLFHKYLYDFYTKHQHYKLNLILLERDMYVVVFTENAYYRAILVAIPFPGTYAACWLIDFGYTAKVGLNDIYFMKKGMFSVTQFAVRGVLASMAPVSTPRWTLEATNKFAASVENKILLAQVRTTSPETKTVFLDLGYENPKTGLREEWAKEHIKAGWLRKLDRIDLKEYVFQTKKKRQANKSGVPKNLKLDFLYPCFVTLENGCFPDTIEKLGIIQRASRLKEYDFFK